MNCSVVICAALFGGFGLLLTGCGKSVGAQQEKTSNTGPAHSTVVPDVDASHFKVDHPEQFPLVTAQEYVASPELNVTGVVNPDVSRQVPVVSLASGRIVEIDARLGDQVKKGQLLFKVRSNDIASAFSNYRQAVKNEELTKAQLDRAKLLFEDGAIPKSTLEIAQNAEDDNLVLLDTAKEQLGLLGLDAAHPTGTVNVYAPVSGVITDQEVTNAAGVQALTAPNPFTISDMSHVWVLCDVYENDLAQVQLGEFADLRLTAYPDKLLRARIGNIGPILDPNIRTAKVRLELDNPGLMRLGMFVTATFHGPRREKYASIPAAAILHLHDREWVYTPARNGYFRRLEVVSGNTLGDGMQQIIRGISPGVQVVSNALDLQHTVSE
ncbi:MAG: efflux RND transporter periplasmic adaptor subunit [Acidobacteriaceae bacterium]|nr:efflux RND transporter periplasmic adaptor subunit [Acidobacteriaceae bacterium]MBV9294264.1 efflux RND transporter periplasmic adaptor subunit [Acidobacteriaceae bacterium]MBV9766062.1 efflux RND transporter periplasmic adaptor subunit [Acidobacteriaceae bacterium]